MQSIQKSLALPMSAYFSRSPNETTAAQNLAFRLSVYFKEQMTKEIQRVSAQNNMSNQLRGDNPVDHLSAVIKTTCNNGFITEPGWLVGENVDLDLDFDQMSKGVSVLRDLKQITISNGLQASYNLTLDHYMKEPIMQWNSQIAKIKLNIINILANEPSEEFIRSWNSLMDEVQKLDNRFDTFQFDIARHKPLVAFAKKLKQLQKLFSGLVGEPDKWLGFKTQVKSLMFAAQ